MKTIFLSAMMAMAGFAMDSSARFNVNFPFKVGNTKFPAGQYMISIGIQGPQVMRIVSNGPGPSAFLPMGVVNTVMQSEAKGELVFACVDSGCTIDRVVNLRNGFAFSSLKKSSSAATLITVKMGNGKTLAD
ncbi:MAG: hypothetical protein NTW74_25325 [Acidobacteria bacterium]|nr:hypothetical protein [Acidobacteriota bacterium]